VNYRENNNKHLTILWAIVLFAFMWALAGPIIDALRGKYSGVVLVAILLPLLFLARFLVTRRAAQKIERLLLNDNPDVLIQYYHTSMRPGLMGKIMPSYKHAYATISAFAYSLYGDIDNAWAALNELEWDGVPPYVQSGKTSVISLIHYIAGDPNQGLAMANHAIEESSVSANYPGVHSMIAALEMFRNLGLVLVGDYSQNVVDELVQAYDQQLGVLHKIVAAWGLAIVYKKRGDVEGYRKMRDFVRIKGPYLRPVIDSIDRA